MGKLGRCSQRKTKSGWKKEEKRDVEVSTFGKNGVPTTKKGSRRVSPENQGARGKGNARGSVWVVQSELLKKEVGSRRRSYVSNLTATDQVGQRCEWG